MKNLFFTPIFTFFCGSTDFAEIFTQFSYHYCGWPEPLTSMKYAVFEKLLGKPKIFIFRASPDLTKDPATGKIFKSD